MEFSSNTTSTNSENIFVDNVKVVTADINYETKQDWQTYSDDMSINMTLDIGRDFQPNFYIGGNFKKDETSGQVIGWGTAFKIKLFFDAIGMPIRLSKGKLLQDQRLPDDAASQLIGKEFARLTYKSTKLKKTGDNMWKEWQETRPTNVDHAEFKDIFRNAVTNNWIKDFLSPDDDVPFNNKETATVDLDMNVPL